MKRILSSILFAAMLSITACGGGSTGTETTAADTSAVETEADIFAGMDVKDYGGRKFNFLVRSGYLDSFISEEATGDVLDDALYERDQVVEERFNVEINPIAVAGAWSQREEFLGTIRSSVMAGDGAYDLIDGYAGVIGDGYSDKLFMNMLEVPNLRLNEEWWSATLTEALTVNDKLYAITGDFAINMWGMLEVLYFNKGLMDDFDREYPYEKVQNGTWTYDAFLSDIKDVASDMNGDSKMEISDRWGFISYDTRVFEYFFNSFGVAYGKPDEEALYKLDLKNEQIVTVYELMYALKNENSDMLFTDAAVDWTAVPASFKDCFTSGRAMYYQASLGSSVDMRSADIEFGIVPYPKLDADQEGYRSTSRDDRTMFVIPVDVQDVDFCGNILEALTVSGHEIVIPAYYDITLKGKSVRDDESAAMLDIIRAGLYCDFVTEHATQAGGGGRIIRNTVGYEYGEVSSYVASNQTAFDEQLEKFLEAYAD